MPDQLVAKDRLQDSVDWASDKATADKRIVGAALIVSIAGATDYERAAGLADREARTPPPSRRIWRISSSFGGSPGSHTSRQRFGVERLHHVTVRVAIERRHFHHQFAEPSARLHVNVHAVTTTSKNFTFAVAND